MSVAVILPAGRIRTLIVAISVILFVVLLLAFRLMRPEELTNPENFTSVVQYFQSLQTPGSPLLPTTWVYDGIRAALSRAAGSSLFHLSLGMSFAGAAVCGAAWLSERFYFRGYSRAQTTPGRLFAASPRRPANWRKVLGLLSGPARAFVIKEIRTFFRDQTQWPQLFLIGALVVIYLYNFSVLPLDRSPIRLVYLQNTISFLNMGLAVFVLTAVAARFVFPAVSMEGDAFWIVRAAPVPIRTFLWIKFFVYYLPLLAMAEVLIVVTNLFLQVTPFMMVLSTITVFCMVPGVVSMAVGLGAIYPDFKSENPAQAATSFGGLVFMILCAGFIGVVALLEAGPTHAIFMAGMRNASLTPLQWTWTAASFAAAFGLCAAAVFVPMRLGEKRLSDLN
jgi:ABC-2 type transport system permease protein